MDNPAGPRPFDDVARPGATPAAPSSNPVIVGNQTTQTDPMMSPKQPTPPTSPTIPVVPPMGTVNQDLTANVQPTVQSDPVSPTAEPLHKLTHEQPFFGQMKPVKTRAKKALIIAVTLLIVGGIGYGAWYLFNKKSGTNQTSNTPAPVAAKTTEVVKDTIPANFVNYQNTELGLSFSYPKDWGEVSIGADAAKAQYGSSNYKHVTFSTQKLVNLNIVQGPFASPLDGCGLEPVKAQEYSLAAARASTVGWDNKGINFYYQSQSSSQGEVTNYSFAEDENPGFTVLTKKDKAIAYQAIGVTYKAETKAQNSCFDITQKEADSANQYNKFILFAMNYTNTQTKGVNAQYDARTSKDQTIVNNILITLNSFTKS